MNKVFLYAIFLMVMLTPAQFAQAIETPSMVIILAGLLFVLNIAKNNFQLREVEKKGFGAAVLLFFYVLLTLFWSPDKRTGLQNISVIFLLPFAFFRSITIDAKTQIQFLDLLFALTAVGALLIGTYIYIQDSDTAYKEARGFAMLGAFLMAYMFPRSFVSLNKNALVDGITRVFFLLISAIVITYSITTGSRFSFMASVTVVFLSVFYSLPKRGRIILVLMMIPFAAILLSPEVMLNIFEALPGMGERFAVGDMTQIMGISINTTGRNDLWTTALNGWLETPTSFLFGNGIGSITYILASYREEHYVHNDYLKTAHDCGLIGVTLFVFVVAYMCIMAWKRQGLLEEYFRNNRLITGKIKTELRLIYKAAFIMAAVVIPAATVENPFSYSCIIFLVVFLVSQTTQHRSVIKVF